MATTRASSVLLLLLLLPMLAAGQAPEVEIPGLGGLRGATVPTHSGDKHMHQFLGVPYASAPRQRFQEAGDPESWGGWRDASLPARACLQLPIGDLVPLTGPALNAQPPAASREEGDDPTRDPEDCLTLDIYTPTLEPSARLPVLLYIHGGYFVYGHSRMARGEFLLDHTDMVLVSAQYRLGPGGFLPLRRQGAPGSVGLRDLLKALHWVRSHIHLFGGNPDHVVASGVSAGAALAGFLHASPASRRLLAGAALFSGGALSPWALDRNPERSTRGVAAFAGCLRPDPLLECLRSRSPALLMGAWALWTAYEKLHGRHGMGGVIPALDPDPEPESSEPGHLPLLPRHPRHEYTDEDQEPGPPLLLAVAKHEGTFLHKQVDMFYIGPRNLTHDQRTLDRQLGQLMLSFADVEDPLHVFGDAIRRLFFPTEALGNYSALYEGLVDFTGAAFFKGPAQLTAQLATETGSDAYLLTFVQEPENEVGGMFKQGAVHHAIDQLFLFPLESYEYTERDLQLARLYSGVLASFVRDLKPTAPGVKWEPYREDRDDYVAMRSEPEMRSGFTEEFFVMENDRQEQEESTGEQAQLRHNRLARLARLVRLY